jgi:hypothetical protein
LPNWLVDLFIRGNPIPANTRRSSIQPLWDTVQAQLASNASERNSGKRTRQRSLLTGMLFDRDGNRMTPSHAVKKGTRYPYYVSPKSVALLFPIEWPEPFGLVMIEAMACGTPVIAFRRGSVPEVVEHGTSGFVVDGESEAVAAVARIDGLDRHQVRHAFDRRFTTRRMTDDYLRSYQKLLDRA